MFCKNCGAKMNDESKFCPKCGTKREIKSVPVLKVRSEDALCDSVENAQEIEHKQQVEEVQNNDVGTEVASISNVEVDEPSGIVGKPLNLQVSNDSLAIEPNLGRKKNTWLLIMAIVIGLIAIAGVAIIMVKLNSDKQEAVALASQSQQLAQETTVQTTQSTTEQTTTAVATSIVYVPYDGKALPNSNLEAMVLQGASRYYTDEELAICSQYELSILRNGLYALSGKRFTQNGAAISFFGGCSWYRPDTTSDSVVKGRWNKYQRVNLNTIVKYER